MTVSLEALAMSGADFLKVGLDFEEWEQNDSEIPPYMLADEEDEDADDDNVKGLKYGNVGDNDDGKRELGYYSEKLESKNWSIVGKNNEYVQLSYGIVIIWAILVVIKYRKSRKPFTIPLVQIVAEMMHSCL